MINNLEGLNIEEIKTAIEFCKDKFKKTNYIDFCELYDQCDSCPINSQIEEGVDCEQAYLYVKYKYLITEELIEELQEKSWEYCNLDCHNCKLKDIWEGKDDCVTFIDMATDCFKIETEEEIKEKMDKELLEARIKTIEKKVDMILQILLEKNN